MTDSVDQAIQRAIATISQSDPLIRLLQQVTLGRMQPTDAGLRAVIESWLSTYQMVLETTTADRQGFAQLDPSPRLAVLIEAGMLCPDHPAVSSLRATFEKALANAPAPK